MVGNGRPSTIMPSMTLLMMISSHSGPSAVSTVSLGPIMSTPVAERNASVSAFSSFSRSRLRFLTLISLTLVPMVMMPINFTP